MINVKDTPPLTAASILILFVWQILVLENDACKLYFAALLYELNIITHISHLMKLKLEEVK